jgi:hypothetical protein
LSSHFLLSVFRVDADVEAVAVAADDAADLGWFTSRKSAGCRRRRACSNAPNG